MTLIAAGRLLYLKSADTINCFNINRLQQGGPDAKQSENPEGADHQNRGEFGAVHCRAAKGGF